MTLHGEHETYQKLLAIFRQSARYLNQENLIMAQLNESNNQESITSLDFITIELENTDLPDPPTPHSTTAASLKNIFIISLPRLISK